MWPEDLFGRYNIELDQSAIETGWQACYDLMWSLHADLSKPVADGEKVVSPYDKAASADITSKSDVAEWLAEFTEKLASFVDEQPNRAYWLSEQFKSVSQFVTGEVHYARRKSEKSIPVAQRSNAADMKRADIKTLATICRNFYNSIPALAAAVDAKLNDKGELSVPTVRERQASEIPTSGRHVRAYYITWTVRDETFPAGTDPMDVVREIWTGTERVGKKIGDLWEPFDKLGVSKLKPGETLECVIDGVPVTATMTEVETETKN